MRRKSKTPAAFEENENVNDATETEADQQAASSSNMSLTAANESSITAIMPKHSPTFKDFTRKLHQQAGKGVLLELHKNTALLNNPELDCVQMLGKYIIVSTINVMVI